MAVNANTITTADVCTALDQEMVENFRGDYDRLSETLGLFPVETVAAGSALYQVKISGTLSDTTGDAASSGTKYVEGDSIARSKYTVAKTSVGEKGFVPYAKQTTAQAILKSGFENAVTRTDVKALQQLRGNVLSSFFAAMANGTTSSTGKTLQAVLAQADADLGDKLEGNGDDGSAALVHFVSRQDVASYLANAQVTLQTAFGMSHLQSFLGVENVVVTSKVAKGTVYVTPVENIHVYGLDFSTLGEAGLVYESDPLGLIGVHHVPDYDRASAETYLVNGATFLPEVTDYIAKGTIAPGA